MRHHSCVQQSLALPSTSELVCISRFRFARGGGGARRFVLLRVDSADPYTKTYRSQHIWSISAAVRAATGAANVPTNLRCSEVTGAQVGRDTLRCGHGRLGGTPLLRHVCGPVGTVSDLTVCTSAHLFAKRRRNWGAQRSFLEGTKRHFSIK